MQRHSQDALSLKHCQKTQQVCTKVHAQMCISSRNARPVIDLFASFTQLCVLLLKYSCFYTGTWSWQAKLFPKSARPVGVILSTQHLHPTIHPQKEKKVNVTELRTTKNDTSHSEDFFPKAVCQLVTAQLDTTIKNGCGCQGGYVVSRGPYDVGGGRQHQIVHAWNSFSSCVHENKLWLSKMWLRSSLVSNT